MTKYMVISYDIDEAQTFTDFVQAAGKQAAFEIVEKVRGNYATTIDCLDVKELRELATRLQRRTPAATPFELAMSVDESTQALACGTPEELNTWAEQDGVGVQEHLHRRKLVDEELGKREDQSPFDIEPLLGR